MCGIVTSVDWAGGSSVQQVKDGLATLRHRGPDGLGVWRSPGGHATLGHARLSVIDLPSGAQPIGNESDEIYIAVNGEFYEFERIRGDLEKRGHRFRTRSDSEILVHLYEEFGVECLEHLSGEFAFVLWDERSRMLFAARDRFGIKPLFFWQAGNTLLLASEVKALHAAGVSAGWDEQGYFEKLVLQNTVGGRTLFRTVSEIQPGHYLMAKESGVTQRQYWDFNYPAEEAIAKRGTDDDYAAELAELLDQAVKTRLRADVPVACYLSGGLDSGSVLALMKKHAGRGVHAFSLRFDNPGYDESLLAQQTAAYCDAEFRVVPITQAALAGHLPATVWHAETIFGYAHCVAKFVLSRAVHKAGFPVVLTGDGADEVFAGYAAFVQDALRETQPAPARRSAFFERLGYLPAWHEVQDRVLDLLQDTLPASFEREAIRERFLDQIDLPGQMLNRSVVNRSLYLFNKSVLPGHVLMVVGDRLDMAHSIEARLPFLDDRVVAFGQRLAQGQKVRGAAEKYVLRKAMRGVVPAAVCGRRKWALQAPPFLLSGGPMCELMQDTLRGKAMEAVPFVDKRAVVRLLETALTADAKRSAWLEVPLMLILTSGLLAESFRLGGVASDAA